MTYQSYLEANAAGSQAMAGHAPGERRRIEWSYGGRVFDLRSFGLTDMLECSAQMQRLGADASSMEEAARKVVDYLYASLVDKETDESAVALVRLYKTHRFDELEPDLRAFASAVSPDRPVAADAPCLTMLATAGDEPAWNDRRLSIGHQAIPLHDPAAIANLPMVYELTRQLGFDEDQVVKPHPDLFRATEGRPGGVFYVAEARGSAHVPAQADFVERHGIRSVIGFGGLLPSGYVFAVVMFAKIAIPRETAESFGALTFAAQLALLPFVERRLFDSDGPDRGPDAERDLRMARAEVAALTHLLGARHHIVAEQSARLELARQEAEERADALANSRRRLAASEATKAAILNAALDAIVTMDVEGRVVDFNPAAERTFGCSRDQAIGQELANLIIPSWLREAHRAGLERYRLRGVGTILGQRIEITAVRSDGSEFPVELTVAAVEADGERLFSGHVRDITDRVEADRALRAAGERYAGIARTLQSSLLPRELPTVPGFELAATYRPGHDGLDVGGDFYDVFKLDDNRWGIVLGDVMGKGAEAAATTALARHTVRAAAIRMDRPAGVLHLLNEALHRDDPDRFCTAVFGLVDLGEPATLTMSSGGHPPPLLRTSSGVSTLEAGGRLLGSFPEWGGIETTVDLWAGDLVLFYSDGVTEARRHAEEYGTRRLMQALVETAGFDAARTIDAITADVVEFATSARDDVAVVALRVVGSDG